MLVLGRTFHVEGMAMQRGWRGTREASVAGMICERE